MRINSVYRGSKGAVILSPDQTKFLWLPERGNGMAQTMYLADLTNDSIKKIVQLKGNETFEKFDGQLLNFSVGVEWTNNTTITYQVYDQKKKQLLHNDPGAPEVYLIGVREKKI